MVLGEVNKSNKAVETAKLLLKIAERVGGFQCKAMVEDAIPKDRRVRKEGSCTRREQIVVLKKRN